MRGLVLSVLMLLCATSGAWATGYDQAVELYQKGNFEAARGAFSPLARGGDERACFALARIYDLGKGVDRNVVEAWRWYRLATGNDAAATRADALWAAMSADERRRAKALLEPGAAGTLAKGGNASTDAAVASSSGSLNVSTGKPRGQEPAPVDDSDSTSVMDSLTQWFTAPNGLDAVHSQEYTFFFPKGYERVESGEASGIVENWVNAEQSMAGTINLVVQDFPREDVSTVSRDVCGQLARQGMESVGEVMGLQEPCVMQGAPLYRREDGRVRCGYLGDFEYEGKPFQVRQTMLLQNDRDRMYVVTGIWQKERGDGAMLEKAMKQFQLP
ncbi:hypothetical protein SAMN02745704_00833 [Paucidesulfovibrio gracilis DSM 16080]|uniref:Sel1 repeat-containing protein n=2 Tax=Paucidesulfovibrio TaxID=2910985 RepID=A0A1T4WDY8_9BACT|nr:hypothetical protein SAMN02745704_00833 [Paucidesulfovibrio gracilis DSM 16080]